jgi:peptidyl-tRNA hydrolase, PTH1 family
VRIGIGRGPAGQDLVARVLTSFNEAEWQVMQELIVMAADAVLWIVEQGMDSAMNRFNARGSVSGRKPDEMAGGNE